MRSFFWRNIDHFHQIHFHQISGEKVLKRGPLYKNSFKRARKLPKQLWSDPYLDFESISAIHTRKPSSRRALHRHRELSVELHILHLGKPRWGQSTRQIVQLRGTRGRVVAVKCSRISQLLAIPPTVVVVHVVCGVGQQLGGRGRVISVEVGHHRAFLW